MRPDEIGQRIRRLRQQRGWTLAELARRAGTSAPTVHRYESGWRRFEVATLGKLATALGCRLDVRFLPASRTEPRRTTDPVLQLRRLFWDRRLRASDLDRYPAWVLGRVLEYGTLEDIRLLEGHLGRERFLDEVSRVRFESRKTRAFWEAMLALEGRECTRAFSRREAEGSWMR